MAWWDPQMAGMVGGIGGAAVGMLCGLQGTLVGTLAPKGKARGLVMGLHFTLLGLGILSVLVGVYALATGQPYHVWHPLITFGSIPAIVLGILLPVVRRRYAEAESRRIDAESIRRG